MNTDKTFKMILVAIGLLVIAFLIMVTLPLWAMLALFIALAWEYIIVGACIGAAIWAISRSVN